ncbi:MAG: hypothetical protein J6Y72_11875 [Bacteroidales bacterium]|nr:hypothetical protein [Bacteroidales bacterium]
MSYTDRNGFPRTIYTDALAATINNIPTKSVIYVKKNATLDANFGSEELETAESGVDMSLVFVPETQLNVYVDGEWSADLSGSYGFGDKATISAPEVSGKTFSYWEADGRPVSSSNPLTLTMNAHTTLRAVYDGSAVSAKVGFTSITRTNDKISFQAIADAQATAVGIIYSTTATGDALTLNGEGVTQAAAERLTDATTTMPVSVLDDNNCWMLKIAPDDANTIYHARVYATIDGTTIYSDVRDVKLADLKDGIRLIANLDGFEEGIDEALTELLKSGEAVARYIVTISGAELDETEANMWSIQPEGGAASGETVTISYNGTRKVKSLTNDDVNPIWNAETKEATFTMPDYNVELKVVYYTQEEIDQAAADAVVALIDALPTEVATTDEAAITAARTAYDALTEAQKAKVSAEELAKLTAAESALAAINEKPTPVVNINADNKQTDVWYDLGGRRLQGKPTTPGLYINNNQKVLVK